MRYNDYDEDDEEYDNRPLLLEDKSELPYFYLTKDEIINKSIIIYGQSKSGKTTTIKEILSILNEYIPTIWLVCPTEKMNEEYKNLIHKGAVIEHISKKFMDDIWERQVQVSQLYKKINNLENFEKLYRRIMHSRVSERIVKINKIKNKLIKSALETKNEGMRNINIKKIESHINEIKMKILKDHIINNKELLLQNFQLSKEEVEIVENIDMCPRTLIIFDDASAELAELKRMKLFDRFATMGRWANITWIVVAHDDKTSVPKEIRKAAFISIFATPQLVLSFFEKSSGNGPSKYDAERAGMASRKIWEFGNREPEKFRKLIWMRETSEIKYYLPVFKEDVMFGSKSFLELCDRIEMMKNKKNNEIQNTNSYISKMSRQ